MTYEPITYDTFHDAALYGFLWGLGFFIVFWAIAYFTFRRDSEFVTNVAATSVGAFIIPFIAVFYITSMVTSYHNSQHLQDNIMHKYNIEGMAFNGSTNRGSTGDPTKTEAQEVKITSDGKTRLLWLIQNPETSEPTLLNYDTGKPVEDLLRKP